MATGFVILSSSECLLRDGKRTFSQLAKDFHHGGQGARHLRTGEINTAPFVTVEAMAITVVLRRYTQFVAGNGIATVPGRSIMLEPHAAVRPEVQMPVGSDPVRPGADTAIPRKEDPSADNERSDVRSC